jgi:hypothetical protein
MLAIAGLCACNGQQEIAALNADGSAPQVWVFTQINVPEENGEMESYYYYARVAKPLYERISSNQQQSGFITLRDVHYWDDDDHMHAYRDIADHGELVFRIEDIRSIKLQNRAPVVGQNYQEYEAGETNPVRTRGLTPAPAKVPRLDASAEVEAEPEAPAEAAD